MYITTYDFETLEVLDRSFLFRKQVFHLTLHKYLYEMAIKEFSLMDVTVSILVSTSIDSLFLLVQTFIRYETTQILQSVLQKVALLQDNFIHKQINCIEHIGRLFTKKETRANLILTFLHVRNVVSNLHSRPVARGVFQQNS